MDLSGSGRPRARQLTSAPHNHVLTNCNVFSPDSQWIVYDVRSNQGAVFDGDRIERVRVRDGIVQTLYRGKNGAHCGVVTCSPREDKVVFIQGPEHPTPDFSYGPSRRQGILLDVPTRQTSNLDARDLVAPYTAGALRGGSHVHVFCPGGTCVSFTYDDHVLEALGEHRSAGGVPQRTVAVSVLGQHVHVPRTHPRNHGGAAFSVVVVKTTGEPAPGSDQVSRAFEEAWIGSNGYIRPDGTRQCRALAFQGDVKAASGQTIPEVFVVDLPEDLTRAGSLPLQGTPTTRPAPPVGCSQRRLTFTTARRYPGLQGPRHWLRSSADGARIAFLMKDDAGIVQLWTVSPNGGPPTQITRNRYPITSAFTWNPSGQTIAHAMEGGICLTDIERGTTHRLTDESTPAPRPEACVFSPDGSAIAFVAPVASDAGQFDQIFLVTLDDPT